MPQRDRAAYFRAYRAKRSLAGKRTRSGKRSWSCPDFVAWDGEGCGKGRSHRYVYLANSRGADRTNINGLSSIEAIDTLLTAAIANPKAVHVFFGGGYDFNMILRDLRPQDLRKVYPSAKTRAQRLPVRVRLGNRVYGLLWRPRKSLFIGRFKTDAPLYIEDSRGNKVANYDAKITLWDAWGFFQSTFVGALEKYFPEGVPGLESIAAMKARRSTFTIDDLDEFAAYCRDECRWLEALMQRLATYADRAGIHPARWDGAGAAAAALLRARGVKAHVAPVPDDVFMAARIAYAGGRIELLQLGSHDRPIFQADIASAYPWAATMLPSLHGTWERTLPIADDRTALIRATFSFPPNLPWYPLFYRGMHDEILFPQHGEGWYHLCEYVAAQRFVDRFGGELHATDAWTFTPSCNDRPFAFVPVIFAQRLEWKRSGDGAEFVLKLSMNSLYGKTAQQIGGTADRPPPYFSLVWAGEITARTRSRLVEAALRSPESIVAFATDGILSTSPIALPNYGADLGAWEVKTFASGVFVQAGVYWLHNGEKWQPKYRGFDRNGMETPEKIVRAWLRGKTKIKIPCTRFVGAGSALASLRYFRKHCTWHTLRRELDLTGSSAKRMGARSDGRGLTRLVPAFNHVYDRSGTLSAPYPLQWRAEEADRVGGIAAAIVNDEHFDSTI